MKINNINNNINFGKVIKIKDAQRDGSLYGEYTHTEQRIAQILSDEKCYDYSQEEKEQIKDFFKSLVEDGKVLFKHVADGKYFVTGQEAKDIIAVEEFANDVNKLNFPSTKHIQAGGYDTYDSQAESMLSNFKKDINKYVFPKKQNIIKDGLRHSDNITLEIINDNPLSAKAQAIIATTKTENGITTKRIDFSA